MPDWSRLLRVDGFKLQPGVPGDALDEADDSLHLRLPEELRSLYVVSDGVFDASGEWFVIWPLQMLVEENRKRRQAGLLPEDHLAFGDDGAGDPFLVQPGEPTVKCWHPIEDRMVHLARDLVTFWQGWTTGTIRT